MGNHLPGKVYRFVRGVVVTYKRFQYISMANMVATILFTFFFIDKYSV